MTTLDQNAVAATSNATQGRTWLPKWPTVKHAILKTVALSSITFALGGITTALLEEPLNIHAVPWALEQLGHHQQLDLFRTNAEGNLKLEGCYKLLIAPWSTTLSGRMVEITDPAVCSAVPTGDIEDTTPVQFKTAGTRNGAMMNFFFTHLTNDPGGGAFSGDSSRNPGVFIGQLAAMAHDPGKDCKLTQFWAVIGKPSREKQFEEMLRDVISNPGVQAVSAAPVPPDVTCNKPKEMTNASN
jgi:hypothetical protein